MAAVEEEEVSLESQESMMVDTGVPLSSSIFIAVLYMCCFCCIGSCVWMFKRKSKQDKVNEIQIEVSTIDESKENKKSIDLNNP